MECKVKQNYLYSISWCNASLTMMIYNNLCQQAFIIIIIIRCKYIINHQQNKIVLYNTENTDLFLPKLTAARGCWPWCRLSVWSGDGIDESSWDPGGEETEERSYCCHRVTSPVTITKKAPTRALSWLKVPASTFTSKTLLRHYEKQALTPWSLNVKLGPQCKGHKGRAVRLA